VAKSTQAEVMRRVAEIMPLVTDCLTLREIRAYTLSKTDWGASISESQLKRYCAKVRELLREAAKVDAAQEFGAAKRRLERVIARSSARGDMRTLLSANKQLTELLGLAAPQTAQMAPFDLEAAAAAARAKIEEKIGREIDRRQRGETFGWPSERERAANN